MSNLPKGKHVGFIDIDSPQGLGICDSTGFVFKRRDLQRQLEWRGQRLIWTGFYVGGPYLDVPNPQNIPPVLQPDPIPLIDPRPPQGTLLVWNSINSPFWEEVDYLFWEQWGTYQDGYPAIPWPNRLSNLEAGGSVDYGNSVPGYWQEITDETQNQAQIYASLNMTRWDAN